MINIIVAYDKNRLIGNGDKLPWPTIKEDFAHFKSTTLEKAVVMGRKTWDGLPKKPLPKRHNLVLSRKDQFWDIKDDGWVNGHTNLQFVFAFSQLYVKDVYVIGGAEIYNYFLEQDLVNKIIASEIKGQYKGDIYFPEIKKEEWDMKIVKEFSDFNIVEYTKKRNS